MKKSCVKIVALILVSIMMVGMLTACGKTLKGTYKTDSVLGSYTSFTFSGSKVTWKSYLVGNEVASITGTYKIDGDSITFTWDSDDSGDAPTGSMSFEETEDGIKIGVLTLKKA